MVVCGYLWFPSVGKGNEQDDLETHFLHISANLQYDNLTWNSCFKLIFWTIIGHFPIFLSVIRNGEGLLNFAPHAFSVLSYKCN